MASKLHDLDAPSRGGAEPPPPARGPAVASPCASERSDPPPAEGVLAASPGPAARVLGAAFVVVSIATTPPRLSCAALVLAISALGSIWLNRPSLADLARRGALAAPLLLALLLPFALAGGYGRALTLGMRSLASVLSLLAFTTALRAHELAAALRALGLPSALCQLVATLLRQLGAVRAQGQRILLARRLRGGRRTWWLSADVMASLLAKTAQRADRAQLAARLRGAPDEASQRARLAPPDATYLALSLLIALAAQLGRTQ